MNLRHPHHGQAQAQAQAPRVRTSHTTRRSRRSTGVAHWATGGCLEAGPDPEAPSFCLRLLVREFTRLDHSSPWTVCCRLARADSSVRDSLVLPTPLPMENSTWVRGAITRAVAGFRRHWTEGKASRPEERTTTCGPDPRPRVASPLRTMAQCRLLLHG